jgi:ferredoxin
MMRLYIDYDRCNGNGRCCSLFPDLFVDDERGYGQTRNDGVIGEDRLAEAERVILCCPEQAIAIEQRQSDKR